MTIPTPARPILSALHDMSETVRAPRWLLTVPDPRQPRGVLCVAYHELRDALDAKRAAEASRHDG